MSATAAPKTAAPRTSVRLRIIVPPVTCVVVDVIRFRAPEAAVNDLDAGTLLPRSTRHDEAPGPVGPGGFNADQPSGAGGRGAGAALAATAEAAAALATTLATLTAAGGAGGSAGGSATTVRCAGGVAGGRAGRRTAHVAGRCAGRRAGAALAAAGAAGGTGGAVAMRRRCRCWTRSPIRSRPATGSRQPAVQRRRVPSGGGSSGHESWVSSSSRSGVRDARRDRFTHEPSGSLCAPTMPIPWQTCVLCKGMVKAV